MAASIMRSALAAGRDAVPAHYAISVGWRTVGLRQYIWNAIKLPCALLRHIVYIY